MNVLLLVCAMAAGVPMPAAEEPPKPAPKVVVKSFVVSGNGEAELLDDQGVAWVDAGKGGPLQIVDLLGPRRYIGVQLLTLTPELRRHFGVPDDRGVMVSKVLEETPASLAGIEVGDVLISADGAPIDNAGDVSEVLAGKGEGEDVQIDLWRDGKPMGLAVGFEERQAKRWNVEAPILMHPTMLHERGRMPVDAQALADKTITVRALQKEELDDALRALDTYFQSEEWQQRARQLKSLDLDAVQQRLRALEQRLQELELQLAEKRR